MNLVLRAAAVGVAVLCSIVVAGTASAAPPLSFEQDAVSKLNAANSVRDRPPARRRHRPAAQRHAGGACGAEYLKGVLESLRLHGVAAVRAVHRHPQHRQGDVAERDAAERPELADERVA